MSFSDPIAELKKLFNKGEGLFRDFKEKVDDPQKIATSISAFANTRGGKLIIGIKDTGGIRGIIPAEQEFMLQRAIQEFLKPKLDLGYEVVGTDKKKVLICSVPSGSEKPYFAKTNEGWRAFYRVEDSTIKASKTLTDILKLKNKEVGTTFSFSDHEKWLLEFLLQNEEIHLKEFSKQRKIPFWKAGKILSRLAAAEVIKFEVKKSGLYFNSAHKDKGQ